MRWILALLTGLLVAAALTAWGQSPRPARTHEDDEAARAVRALAAAEMSGPAKRDACSSPFGGTRYGFDAACARHDAGYAELRRAADDGYPLGPWARQAIDARFAADLAADCRSTGCLLSAATYEGAVRFNSWRQGDGVPVVESWWAVALAWLVGLGTALLVAVRRLRRGLGRRLGLDPSSGPAPALPLAAAAAGLALAVQPTTLPHPLWVTVLIGGVVAAQTWAAGALARRVVRAVAAARGSWPTVLRDQHSLITAGVGVGFAFAVGHAYVGQAELAASVGSPAPSLGTHLLGVAGAALLSAVLVIGSRAGARALRRALRRSVEQAVLLRGRRRASRVVALASVALPAALLPGWGAIAPVSAPQAPPAAGVAVSSDPAGWDAAGPKARDFVSGAGSGNPSRNASGNASGTGSPLRVYAPREAAADQRIRAELAVRALDRAGGFDRAVVLVVVPTGSGWVNPAAPAALERREHGDVATLAVQYAESPSWVAFLRGGEGVDTSVRAVFAALDRRLATMPADRRPRVLAYGESLGAWGGLRAAGTDDGLPPGADGALWTGVPAGSPKVAIETDVVELTHGDDPVASWSPALAVRPDAAWRHPWLPVLSFWQATADVIAARDVPAGHGHRYESELDQAWDRVLARVTSRPSTSSLA